jgi:hypothetical protein
MIASKPAAYKRKRSPRGLERMVTTDCVYPTVNFGYLQRSSQRV